MNLILTPRQVHDARDAVGAIRMAAEAMTSMVEGEPASAMLEIIVRRAIDLEKALREAET